MRAHQIMTKNVISINEETSIVDAARLMLQHQISGLPVVRDGKLTGILSESDFIRRAEIGTERKRARWLQFLVGPGKAATEFVEEHGRKAGEVMTRDPYTDAEDTSLSDADDLMESKNIKRLPVVRDQKLVGIITRSNLLQAVAALAREIPDPTADDDHIRRRIIDTIEDDWRPIGLSVTVRDGIVHIYGIVTDDRARHASVVAAENVPGVKVVHDHLRWVDPLSGVTVGSLEDEKAAEAT